MRTPLRAFAVASVMALSIASAFADDDAHGNFALQFRSPTTLGTNPAGAIATTANGSPVTLQNDDLEMEALVKWSGRPARSGMIVYNGHGCCSGWGILLMGDDQAPFHRGKLAVLAGGVTVEVSAAQLPVGEWARVRMERRSGIVTIGVRGSGKHDDEQLYNLGFIHSNPLGVDNRPVVGGTVRTTERLTVGENFNGYIDDVTIRTLAGTTIEYFGFNHPSGFIAVGDMGKVLNLQSAAWTNLFDHDNGDGNNE